METVEQRLARLENEHRLLLKNLGRELLVRPALQPRSEPGAGTRKVYARAGHDHFEFVDLDSAQTITGAKTFEAGAFLDKGNQVFDVRAYGLGEVPDALAIQRAVEACDTAGGGIVLLPEGNFILLQGIEVWDYRTFVRGANWRATVLTVPPSFESSSLGVFAFRGGGEGYGVAHLHIAFQHPDTSTRASLVSYPPAIYAVGTPRFVLERARISGAMTAVKMTGNSGGAWLSSLEISSFDKSIEIDGSLDTVRISKLHVWPFDLTANQTLIMADTSSYGLYCARVDDLDVNDSLFHVGIGARFYDSGTGQVPGGKLNGVSFDTYSGILMEDGQITMSGAFSPAGASNYAIDKSGGTLVVNGALFNPGSSVGSPIIDNSGGELTLNGCYYSVASIDQVFVRSSAGVLNINGGIFDATADVAHSDPIIHVTGGTAQVVGPSITPKGANAGTFIDIDTDGEHFVSVGPTNGWSVAFPAASNGVYQTDAGSPIIGALDASEFVKTDANKALVTVDAATLAGELSHDNLGGVSANDHHNQSHGAADHTDRTRTFSIYAQELLAAVGTPALALGGSVGSLNGTPVMLFDTTTEEWAVARTRIPQDWAGGAITVKALWSPTNTNTGTVFWNVLVTYVADGEEIDQNADHNVQNSTQAANGTTDDLHIHTVGTFDPGDQGTHHYLRVAIGRITGSDTYNADAALIEILFEYTADS